MLDFDIIELFHAVEKSFSFLSFSKLKFPMVKTEIIILKWHM